MLTNEEILKAFEDGGAQDEPVKAGAITICRNGLIGGVSESQTETVSVVHDDIEFECKYGYGKEFIELKELKDISIKRFLNAVPIKKEQINGWNWNDTVTDYANKPYNYEVTFTFLVATDENENDEIDVVKTTSFSY